MNQQPGGKIRVRLVRLCLVLLPLGLLPGCSDPVALPRKTRDGAQHQQQSENLFDYAAANLNRLPEFGPTHILPQIVERLNQWSANEKPQVKWQIDPVIDTFGDPQQRKGLQAWLESTTFDSYDGFFLRETVWLRDVANQVNADFNADLLNGRQPLGRHFETMDDREKVARLFDWTVRNIQLDADAPPAERAPLRPWEALLMGRGTLNERAWVFMLLARQLHLDVVLLATPDPKLPDQWNFWNPAHFYKGQLYIYDVSLGLPIPGPAGKGVATLEQAAADPAILQQLDASGMPYPIKSSQLKQVLALVEADPWYLSRRMKTVESRLSGDRKLVLNVAPTPLMEQLLKSPHVSQARVWLWPMQVMGIRNEMNSPGVASLKRKLDPIARVKHERREQHAVDPAQANPNQEDEVVVHERTYYPLWSGRLQHFQGRFDAVADAPDANPAAAANNAAVGEGAKNMYLLARAEPAKAVNEQGQAVLLEDPVLVEDARENATYWLGLVNYEQRNYDVAIDYFSRTLKEWPNGQWAAGAKYNLARAYEASGQPEKAIPLLENPGVNMPVGAKLRVKQLKAQMHAAAGTMQKSTPGTGEAKKNR
ncbi:MAG: tetratricopeptide repeat protein [Planctomycetia bacterium]|nr:tetratricopeptide repeat protein [Planctomycetia bacterium]